METKLQFFPTADLADPALAGYKLCVLRHAIFHPSGQRATGVFFWQGKSWRTATVTHLVKRLPDDISDKQLSREYQLAVRQHRQAKAQQGPACATTWAQECQS